MDSALFFSLVPLLLITVLIIIKRKAADTHTKPLPPTPPFSLPFIGHLYRLRKPLHLSLARLSSRHGPLLLVHFGSRPVLLISSLPIARELFTSPATDVAFASRPLLPSTKNITYNHTTLASAPYGPHWRNIRRIATLHLLSAHRLQLLSYIRHHEVESLVCSLFREHDTESEFKKVEMKSRLFGLAFNVIMRMIAGKRYYWEDGNDDEARRFREMVEETVSLAGVSNASDFLPVLRWVDFGGVRRKMRKLEEKREVLLQGLIDEERSRKAARGEEEKKGTLIEVLLGLQDEDPQYYTDDIIKAFIVTLLLAGTDTSTDTVEWTMSFLLNHPAALQTARSEIDSTVGNARLLQEHDLPNLPYLQSIISETLRLIPVAPLLVPHESIEECKVGGYTIPRGTMLLVNAWAVHRDPLIWEEDPTEFRPERFMNGDGSNKNIIPFGMGRRRCPGDGLASKVIGLVLGTMIQCFEWERIGEEMVDMSGGGGLTFHKLVPLELMYKRRKAMVNVLSQI